MWLTPGHKRHNGAVARGNAQASMGPWPNTTEHRWREGLRPEKPVDAFNTTEHVDGENADLTGGQASMRRWRSTMEHRSSRCRRRVFIGRFNEVWRIAIDPAAKGYKLQLGGRSSLRHRGSPDRCGKDTDDVCLSLAPHRCFASIAEDNTAAKRPSYRRALPRITGHSGV